MESTYQGRRSRRSFSEQYKAEVVALCQGSEKSMSEIARDLDLTESSVRRWGGPPRPGGLCVTCRRKHHAL